MRKIRYLFVALIVAGCANSSDNKSEPTEPFYAPAEGTIIAADSMPIVEDKLNDFHYIVKLSATPESTEGIYLLDAAFGFNFARTEVVFPKLGRKIIPALRVDEQMPYSYIIGFRYDGDNTFNDYARIYALRNEEMKQEIQMKYLKSYYLDTAR